jgi:hypothetical protein
VRCLQKLKFTVFMPTGSTSLPTSPEVGRQREKKDKVRKDEEASAADCII